MDFLAQGFGLEVAAEERGPLDLPELKQRLVRRVLQVVAREPTENVLRLGRAKSQGRRIFHHRVVLPGDQLPVDRARENSVEVWIIIGTPGLDAIEPLLRDARSRGRRSNPSRSQNANATSLCPWLST